MATKATKRNAEDERDWRYIHIRLPNTLRRQLDHWRADQPARTTVNDGVICAIEQLVAKRPRETR